MPKRRIPQTSMTIEEQAAQLAQIDAELERLRVQRIELGRRADELHERRAAVNTQLMRERLQGSVGEYVKMTGNGFWMAPRSRLKPMEGDIGRLLKIGRSRVLIDFGEELHTWYVAIEAVGTVHDPLASSFDELEHEDSQRRIFAEIEEGMDELLAGPDEASGAEEDEHS